MAKKEGEPHVPPEKEGRKAVRFSARPPPRFAKGSDFNLWVQRLELYFKEADVPAEKRGEELVSLLEDDAFRIVSQLGFVGGDGVEYGAVKTCLRSSLHPEESNLSGSVSFIQPIKRGRRRCWSFRGGFGC